MNSQTREVVAITERIKPLLAGKASELQGAVLADLLAIWLAGHHVAGDEDATRRLRAELLGTHTSAVWQLIEINTMTPGAGSLTNS